MYNLNDTIAAVSSPGAGGFKSIIRVTGPETYGVLGEHFSPLLDSKKGIICGEISIDDEFKTEAKAYTFRGGGSYTGDDLIELHICAGGGVVERIIGVLVSKGLRLAGPGEFTARAYLNGKIDLVQAEAVAEIVASSNKLQLHAAESLFAGRLSKTISQIRQEMLDIMSLVEAGMDFSEEDIEFASNEEIVSSLGKINAKLEELLSGSIRYESMIDMPAVGIAGATNAGKSSLLNALLGEERSIVSEQRATTRDVLTGLMRLKNCECVLFDCAGLLSEKGSVLDELAQEAAREAINSAWMVLFCVDVSKEDYGEDIAAKGLINAERLLVVATKCDLDFKTGKLEKIFGSKVAITSAKTGEGIEELRSVIDNYLAKTRGELVEGAEAITINQRHRKAIEQAIEDISKAKQELQLDNNETATVFIRSGYHELGGLEREHVDEAILEKIFGQFCIGK